MTHRSTLFNERRHPRPGKQRVPKARRTPVPGITWLDAYVPKPKKEELPKTPNRRMDQAVKLLYKGGTFAKEVIGQGQKRRERFYIELNGKTWKVRRRDALALFTQKILDTTGKAKSALAVVWKYTLSQVGRALDAQQLLARLTA